MTVWKKYSLGIVLVVMFLVAWALMTWTDWVSFAAQQAEHHQPADVFGASGYISQWATLTLENWQSDIMGYAVTVILGAYLLYKGSVESRESDDEIEQGLQRIQQALESKPSGAQGQAAPTQVLRQPGRSAGTGDGRLP